MRLRLCWPAGVPDVRPRLRCTGLPLVKLLEGVIEITFLAALIVALNATSVPLDEPDLSVISAAAFVFVNAAFDALENMPSS